MKKSFTLAAISMIALCATANVFDRQNGLQQLAEQRFLDRNQGTEEVVGPRKASVIIDYVMDQPEGELKTYNRSGGCLYNEYGVGIIQDTQSGLSIDMVWTEDGASVWMKSPVSQEGAGSWLKASVEGDKIHMPLYHAVYYWPEYGYGYMLARAVFTGSTYAVDPTAEEMTYTIHDDGTVSLDDTEDGDAILALIWTDNYEWTGFGDFESVYTPFTVQTITIPEGLERQEWMYAYRDGYGPDSRLVEMAFDGDKVYVNNILPVIRDNAIVGTIKGDKIVFESDQCLGNSSGYLLYFTAVETDGKTATYLPQIEMDYNGSKITSPEGTGFVLNVGMGSENMQYWNILQEPSFTLYTNVPAVPADPTVISFDDCFDEWGYNVINLEIPNKDVDGNQLNQEYLKYILWVRYDDTVEEFVFYADEYYSFSIDGIEEMVEVPFNFSSYNEIGFTDIFPGGETIYLYEWGFDDYGIQSVYYGGDERNVSNIDWLYAEPVGISQTNKGMNATAAVYDVQGRKLNDIQHGINIVVNADGSTRKLNVK